MTTTRKTWWLWTLLGSRESARRSGMCFTLETERSKESPMAAALDWSQCPAVERVPGRVSGAWVVKGTRMPVVTIFENLEAGMTVDEITQVFDVTREEVKAVLSFATRSLEATLAGG